MAEGFFLPKKVNRLGEGAGLGLECRLVSEVLLSWDFLGCKLCSLAAAEGRFEVEALFLDFDGEIGAEGIVVSLSRLPPTLGLGRRLLCMTGTGSKRCDFMSGVPCLLGLVGRVEVVSSFDDDGISSLTRLVVDGVGDCSVVVSLLLLLWNFCDDFLGGGLGGGGGIFPGFFLAAAPLSPSRTVEFEEDEVNDSRTDAKPWGSIYVVSESLETLPARRRVTGGRVLAGLSCFALTILLGRLGIVSPGDCEDIEVGVVSRLYAPGPGDSENLVDGEALMALSWLLLPEIKQFGDEGCGRSCVESLYKASAPYLEVGSAGCSWLRYLSNSGYILGAGDWSTADDCCDELTFEAFDTVFWSIYVPIAASKEAIDRWPGDIDGRLSRSTV